MNGAFARKIFQMMSVYVLAGTTPAEMVIFWMKRNISIPIRFRLESITSRGVGMAPISHDFIC